MSTETKRERIQRAKALWDSKQERKAKLVREQQERTANRTPEQIEAQKIKKLAQKARRMKFES